MASDPSPYFTIKNAPVYAGIEDERIHCKFFSYFKFSYVSIGRRPFNNK